MADQTPTADLLRMLRPEHRHLLDAVSSDAGLVWTTVRGDGGEILGLALSSVLHAPVASLVSVFIDSAARGQGLGRTLVRAVEDAVADRGCSSMETRYSTGLHHLEPWEALLARCGWEAPCVHMLCLRMTWELWAARWLQRARPDASCELFAWRDLTDRERTELEQEQASSGEVPPELWPFTEDLPAEPHTSVGLRRKGRVIGWMLTHLVEAKTLRYTSLYVLQRYRTPVRSMALVAEARRRSLQYLEDGTASTLAVLADNHAMFRLATRQFLPHAQLVEEVRVSRKDLAAKQDDAAMLRTR